jgi:hypothetical protein
MNKKQEQQQAALAPAKTECEATRATTSRLNNKTLATNKQKQQQAMTYNKNKHLAAMVATAAAKAKQEKSFCPKWAKPEKTRDGGNGGSERRMDLLCSMACTPDDHRQKMQQPALYTNKKARKKEEASRQKASGAKPNSNNQPAGYKSKESENQKLPISIISLNAYL